MSYNGWKNYETWNVALWISNEQGSQEYWQEAANLAWADVIACPDQRPSCTPSESARLNLADSLRLEFQEANPLADQTSTWSDLLSAALSEVVWDEIANSLLIEVTEDYTQIKNPVS